MMAKAHIAVGMAAAFTAMRPESIPEALPVVTGAALGCLICDLDCDNPRERTESSRYRVAMAVVAAAALIEDHLIGAGMWASVGNHGPYMVCGFCGFCSGLRVREHFQAPRLRAFVSGARCRNSRALAGVPDDCQTVCHSLSFTSVSRFAEQETGAAVLSGKERFQPGTFLRRQACE